MSKEQHFSMIRNFHLADLFTLLNASCGAAAIFSSMNYIQSEEVSFIYRACVLVPLAMFFDVLDGRIARWRKEHSPMGRELDSLADVISFGVAPSAIAYAVGLNGMWDQIILCYFVACGVSRLARYNITADTLSNESGKVRYFEGTPITTSAILVIIIALLTIYGNINSNLYDILLLGKTFHPLSAMFFVSGSLMISKTIHIPKF